MEELTFLQVTRRVGMRTTRAWASGHDGSYMESGFPAGLLNSDGDVAAASASTSAASGSAPAAGTGCGPRATAGTPHPLTLADDGLRLRRRVD